jgi:hypothetical protein
MPGITTIKQLNYALQSGKDVRYVKSKIVHVNVKSGRILCEGDKVPFKPWYPAVNIGKYE